MTSSLGLTGNGVHCLTTDTADTQTCTNYCETST